MSIVEVVRKTTTVVEVAHPGVQGPPGSGGGGGAVDSVNGRTGAVTLTSADVGLSNVNNTSDADKPVSTAQAAADTAVATAASNALAAHVAAADPHTGYALESSLAAVATSGAYADLTGKPTLGTAAPLNVAASGDAASGEVVKGSDSRLTDARTPTTHTHTASQISDSTAAGRAVLTAADAAAQRTALGVPAGSGNSTGTNTGDQTNITGNAGTATALQTARNINGVAFDGTANITINAVDSTARVAKAGDTLTGALNWSATQTIASATTTDIGAATSNSVIVSGTTTITALGTIAAGAERVVQFSGALTLTHNATSLILPGGANITTAAGDVAYFVSLGSGNWRCTGYQKASGQAVVSSGGSPAGSSGNLQYNNAGAFGAVTGSSVSGGNVTLGGGTRNSLLLGNDGNDPVVSASGASAQHLWVKAGAQYLYLWGGLGAQISNNDINQFASVSPSSTSIAIRDETGSANKRGIGFSTYNVADLYLSASGRNIANDTVATLNITGQASAPSSTSNISGGAIRIVAGNGASSSSSVANGGAVHIAGGQGYGVGVPGVVNLAYTGSGARGSVKCWGTLTLDAPAILKSYTVATLPTAASNTHAIVAVTDGNASPTYRGAVTGGGSTKGVVYCDGSSWMWH